MLYNVSLNKSIMKTNRIPKAFLSLVCCLLFVQLAAAQVVVTVQTTDGSSYPITLATGGELQVSDESLTVVADATTTYSYALDEVSKILFAGQVSIREVEAGPAISAYPNPAGGHFALQGVPDGQHQLTLYSANGARVLTTTYEAGQQVDISSLPRGLYLVRIENSVTKLIKQ